MSGEGEMPLCISDSRRFLERNVGSSSEAFLTPDTGPQRRLRALCGGEEGPSDPPENAAFSAFLGRNGTLPLDHSRIPLERTVLQGLLHSPLETRATLFPAAASCLLRGFLTPDTGPQRRLRALCGGEEGPTATRRKMPSSPPSWDETALFPLVIAAYLWSGRPAGSAPFVAGEESL